MHAFFRFFLQRTVFVNLTFTILMVVGVFAFLDLPVERYPNVNMGKVLIVGVLPGASPDDVEALVTTKIEDALDDLDNVEFIRSTSLRERSIIEVKFLDDTDYVQGYKELRFKVLSIQNDLPGEMDPPLFEEVNVNQWLPVVNVNLLGKRSNRSLALVAEEMKLVLERLPGVQEVEIQGEYIREFHLRLSPARLIEHGVTFDQAAAAIQSDNVSIPAGDFTGPDGEFVLRVDERYRDAQSVLRTVIRKDMDGSFVRIGDVAAGGEVGYRDPSTITSVAGENAVRLKVVKTPQGNALDIVDRVEGVVADFTPRLQREEIRAVLTQDQRDYIDDAMNTLGLNLLAGIILVNLVLWYVMGLRNAMLTTVGIPFSFLVTMIMMRLTGNSLNEITLFSFVLVSGIIVDDAIVVVENIFRHLREEGESLLDAVVNGASEVFLPVVSATLTTVAAFLPMLIMTGSTGEFFALVPKAVSFALIASLFECLIFLPSHFLDWPGKSGLLRQGAESPHSERLMDRLKRLSLWLVEKTFRHRVVTIGSVGLAFAGACAILVISLVTPFPLLRIAFFPDDTNLVYVEIEGPVATSIETTSETLDRMSVALQEMGPGMVRNTSATAGFYFNEDYEQVYGNNLGHIAVELPKRNDRHFPDFPGNDPLAYQDTLRERVGALTPAGWTFRVRAEKGGPPTGKDVFVQVYGNDPEMVRALAGGVRSFLAESPDVGPYLLDLDDDQGVPNRIFRFIPQRDRIAEYGLTPAQVLVQAGGILDGRYVGKFRARDEEIDLKVLIDPASINRPEDALAIPLLETDEGPVRLGDVSFAERSMEPGQRKRYNAQPAVAVTANLVADAPVTSTSVVNRVKDWYAAEEAQYPGAGINFSGAFEDTRRSYTSLTYAFLIAVLLIYLILATQFQSYVQPMIIMSAIAFSLTGVILGTFVTRTLFTVNSFIATVGVAGVVVNDSLVLVDFMNKLYRGGLTRMEAVRKGVAVRLRPILLTTVTTTLGLLPMAIGFPSYSLVWGTMAMTFVTGLCTATLLTIFVVPVLWDMVMRHSERVSGGHPLATQGEGTR